MDFAESTKYLYSLGNEVLAMKLGLENVRTLLTALGEPQNNYLKVQVAGTNGKGSVCAFLNSICLEAGVKTGLYTSPHLVSITERVKINGVNVGEDEFAQLATAVRETSEKLVADGDLESAPTFFEQVTAIALNSFAGAKVELAILETGLGGRLDATTAANAEVAAITRIDIDHQEYLGETLEEIAGEKAAIIHQGSRVVVVGEQDSEAMKVITSFSTNLGVSPRLVEKCVRTTCGSGWLKFTTEHAEYELESLGLPGWHQIENAKIAILAAEMLQDHFPISAGNIVEGLTNARHPGRLELSGKYLFDGAHNVGGAKALRAFLEEFVTQPITMIFGAMKDKQVAQIAEILFPKADNLILTQPDNSRAMTAAEIAGYAGDAKNTIITVDVADALERANVVSNDETLILVTGSLYLIGEVKRLISSC